MAKPLRVRKPDNSVRDSDRDSDSDSIASARSSLEPRLVELAAAHHLTYSPPDANRAAFFAATKFFIKRLLS